MRRALLAAIIVAQLGAWPARAVTTAGDLARMCEPAADLPEREASARLGLCIGYLRAVHEREIFDRLRDGPIGCVPLDRSTGRAIFLEYMSGHPGAAGSPAGMVFVEALARSRGCGVAKPVP